MREASIMLNINDKNKWVFEEFYSNWMHGTGNIYKPR